MRCSPRIFAAVVALALLFSACGDATATNPTAPPIPSTVPTAAPTAAPTVTPVPTVVPALADNVRIAGVDVSKLTLEQARAKIEQELAPLREPLELEAGNVQTTLDPAAIKLELPLDALLAQAQQQGAGARIAPDVRYDDAALRIVLDDVARRVATPATTAMISETGVISRSFAFVPGQKLDVDAAVKQIDIGLRSPASRSVTLSLVPDTAPGAQPNPELLQQQLEEMAKLWKGVVGVYVYDLKSDKAIAALNQNTVFSGASVMKVPILLQSYVYLPKFDEQQERWLRKMIVDSDNFSANSLLAAGAGGDGKSTDDALAGALQMSDMLKSLGLEHTYQNMPYESSDYLINFRGIKIKRGPAKEGEAPFTEADPVLRTTPEEISRIFLWIDQCSQGKGVLREKFASSLTAARCQEMLDRLGQNADRTRIVAGLPEGTKVAHKSGWVEDMQADVARVSSPGGDFLLAVYVYRSFPSKQNYLADEIAAPVIARFGRAVYTYYNPVPAS